MGRKKKLSSTPKQPSLLEMFDRYSTEEVCISHFEKIRWPEGPECPKCASKRISKFDAAGKTGKIRHLYECMDCKYQYSVTVGTIFHDTHLPMTTWFRACALMCNAKKGLPAKQLERDLAVTYRTAWYLAHRIRKAMEDRAPGFLVA